ncbi:MAG: single-stranded-DNA-specific exonuclease RecJ [Gemmatimonadaceae bacterium]
MSGFRSRAPARWLPAPAVPPEVARSLEAASRAKADLASRAAAPSAFFRLLAARGVRDVEEAERFFRTALDRLEPPEAMADLPRAAERLAAAVRHGERILVHGDYDVDGICSTALMTRVLRAQGGDVVPFIPDRLRDGYDLGAAGVEAARASGARVVLTCDCGTTAVAPAAALAAMGVDLIISDHHRPGAALPVAFAVVNPQCESREGRDRHLAAVGVAWKLALAVTRALGGDEKIVLAELPLVALATVADVAPLTGDNRILVTEGLRRMGEAPSAGLRALIRASRTDEKRLTAGRLGYTLAPRLNALGRLGSALRGVELLLADDAATANAIARECEELNERRQVMDRKILDEARRAVEALDLDATYGIVLHSPAWHAGVIGIVASRVVELTNRPTMLIAVNDGVGKGSGRSIPKFDLHAALGGCADLLTKHGGHRAAAGLTIDVAQIPAFGERFNRIASERLTPDDLVPELRTDLELPIDEADEAFERALRHLEPFGVGNPGPVLVSRGVSLAGGARRVGPEGLKVRLVTAGGTLEAVGWSLAPRAAELAGERRFDIAYKLEMNEYQGKRTLQATLLDVRPTDA